MNKQYYYLDGNEQKGPLRIEQLSDVGIKSDTLVWSDDMDNWKPAKEVSELASIIKKLPPPPPIVDNYLKQVQIEQEHQILDKTIVEDSNFKLLATFKISILVLVFLGILILFSFSIVNSKKENSRKEILEKIESIFDDKTVILDGRNSGVQGEYLETGYNGEKKNKIKRLLNIEEWWERDGVYTIFKCSSGGFSIKKLTRLSDESFDLETYYSNDLGYRIPTTFKGVTNWSFDEYGEHNTYGVIKSYRREPQICYNKAFDFFTTEDKSGAFTPGKFIDIENFPSIRNDYFYFDNTGPKQYSSASVNASNWHSTEDYSNNVYWDDVRIYYSSKGKHFELTMNDEKYKMDLLKVLGIGFGIFILMVVFISLSKPKFSRNLHLYGKRWKNTSYEDQILFFEHSFTGTNNFKELINDNVSKGVLKITDKGNTINLSYSNKELFYKIEKISKDYLTLISLIDGSSISFVRIGAKTQPKKN